MTLQLEVGKTYKFLPKNVAKSPLLNLQPTIVEVKRISAGGTTILLYSREWKEKGRGHGGHASAGVGHWFLYGEDPLTYHEFFIPVDLPNLEEYE